MIDMTALEALGIDTEEGMAYCAEDAEFYEEMLEEYVSEEPKNTAELQRAFSEKDWGSYQIRAHSLKSSSRMIGAGGFAERAYALEQAARDRDGEKIIAAHASFADDYRSLVGALSALLA